jgi:hypothetical protein
MQLVNYKSAGYCLGEVQGHLQRNEGLTHTDELWHLVQPAGPAAEIAISLHRVVVSDLHLLLKSKKVKLSRNTSSRLRGGMESCYFDIRYNQDGRES